MKEVLESLDLETVKLAIPGDTRWLSLERAVSSLLKVLPGMICALYELAAMNTNDKKSEALAIILGSKEFICTLSLLADVLPVLTNLSTTLQSDVQRDPLLSLIASCRLLRFLQSTTLSKWPSAASMIFSAIRVCSRTLNRLTLTSSESSGMCRSVPNSFASTVAR